MLNVTFSEQSAQTLNLATPQLFITLSWFPSEPQNDIFACVSSTSKLHCNFHEIKTLSVWVV